MAATLDDAQRAGHDPATLLTEATARRELRSAGSMSDVLIWRLRRSAHLPALPDDRNATALRANRKTPCPAPTTQSAPDPTGNDPRRGR